jgi:hypothetical protein
LFVMSWYWDLSDDSFSLQYFRNPGSVTSAILACTQIHDLFCCFAQHCAQPRPSSNLLRCTFAKREFAWSHYVKLNT